MDKSDVLQVGTEVNILRSNGDVRRAFVTSIDLSYRMVKVEWCEAGEVKGKEVPVSSILALNKHLILPDDLTIEPNKTIQSSQRHQGIEVTNIEKTDVRKSFFCKPDLLKSSSLQNFQNDSHKTVTTAGTGRKPTLPIAEDKKLLVKRTEQKSRVSLLPTKLGSAPASALPTPLPGLKTSMGSSSSGGGGRQSMIPLQKNAFSNVSLNSESIKALPTTFREPAALSTTLSSVTAHSKKRRNDAKENKTTKKNGTIETTENRPVPSSENAEMAASQAVASLLLTRRVGDVNEYSVMIKKYLESSAAFDFNGDDVIVSGTGLSGGSLLEAKKAFDENQIFVFVRKRPLNKLELTNKNIDVVSVVSKNTLILHEPKLKLDRQKYCDHTAYNFDYVFDDKCDTQTVYAYTAKQLIDLTFRGGVGTIFAYGQTGSGKTYTMGGMFNGKTQNVEKGIYALLTKDIFDKLTGDHKNLKFTARIAYFEIYCDRVLDLLQNKVILRVLEDSKSKVNIRNLTIKTVKDMKEVVKLLKMGNQCRTSGKTLLNSNSSRSHAIFQIYIFDQSENEVGKISLVDLAGNERGSDTVADETSKFECAHINKSLLALKECIRSLGSDAAHVPFRACTLTKVLRDSFIGRNSKTCMMATLSPCFGSIEYTLNTLRYAERVKDIPAPKSSKKSSASKIPVSPGARNQQYQQQQQQQQQSHQQCDTIDLVDCDEIHRPDNQLSVIYDSEEDSQEVLNQSDLVAIQKKNQDMMSPEMLRWHEVVTECMKSEENLLDLVSNFNDYNDGVFIDKWNGLTKNISLNRIQVQDVIEFKGIVRKMITDMSNIDKLLDDYTNQLKKL